MIRGLFETPTMDCFIIQQRSTMTYLLTTPAPRGFVLVESNNNVNATETNRQTGV